MMMRKTTLAAGLVLAAVAGMAPAQIGTLIPDARLPLASSSPRVTDWQDAGYFTHLSGPIVYTQLVDVTALGAVGDGTTDDTAALNAAIAAAAAESALGGFTIVHLPAGTYRFTSPLNLSSNMVLKGDGAGSTTLLGQLSTGNYLRVINRTNVGIEDLRITATTGNNKSGHTGTLIQINNTTDAYVRGVDSDTAPRNHINIYNSHYVEVRDCYIHHGQDYGGGGNGYGIDLDYGSTKCLIENNVFNTLRHAMLLQNDVNRNVFGYNASWTPVRTEWPTDYSSDITLHGHWDANRTGPALNLFEGNRVNFMFADNSHDANGDYNLFFRNRADYIGLNIDSTNGNTNNQTIVNNFLQVQSFTYVLLGAPYAIGGSGHLSANNRTRTRTLFGSYTLGWKPSQNTSYNAEVSYYKTAKPAFFGAAAWPYNAESGTHPAGTRGLTYITAGWGGYSAAP